MRKFSTYIAILIVVASFLTPLHRARAWGRYEGGHHPAYGGNWARANPVVVHRAYVNRALVPVASCIGCGIGAAAVAGLLGGAVIVTTARPRHTVTPIIVTTPVSTVVPVATPVMITPAIGSQVAALPSDCNAMNVNGAQYYQCGLTWYQPFFGANGVYYTIVPTP